MFIYLITCLTTEKYYVGQHSGKDLNLYLRRKFSTARLRIWSKNHLFNALRKYPLESFIIEPLAEVDSIELLDNLERIWIAVLNARDNTTGMNIAAGGNVTTLGMKHSEEYKREHSLRMKGKNSGAKNGMFGKKKSAETIQKFINSNSGEKHYLFGKKRSEEVRQNISDGHRIHIPPSDDLKWCTIGKHFVARVNFGKANRERDGLKWSCKDCCREDLKTRRRNKRALAVGAA